MLCRSFELPKAILLHYMSIWGGFSPSTATNLRRLLIIAIFIFSLFYSAFIIVSVEARFRHYRIRFMFVFATIIFLTIFLEKDECTPAVGDTTDADVFSGTKWGIQRLTIWLPVGFRIRRHGHVFIQQQQINKRMDATCNQIVQVHRSRSRFRRTLSSRPTGGGNDQEIWVATGMP